MQRKEVMFSVLFTYLIVCCPICLLIAMHKKLVPIFVKLGGKIREPIKLWYIFCKNTERRRIGDKN